MEEDTLSNEVLLDAPERIWEKMEEVYYCQCQEDPYLSFNTGYIFV